MPAEERLTKHAALRSRLRSQSEALSEGKSIGSSVIKGSSVSAHLTKHAVGLGRVRILELHEGFDPIATGGEGVRIALKIALELLHAHEDRDECRLPCPCRLWGGE